MFSLDEVRSFTFGHPEEVISELTSRFKKDAEGALRIWHVTYNELSANLAIWEITDRTRAMAVFLHSAAYSLQVALFLIARGLPTPFGNLMRQYGEATAMALLCADPDSGVLKRYLADKRHYPYHKALERVDEAKTSKRLADTLGLDQKAWAIFKELNKFYDHHSHLSVVTMGFAQRLSDPPAAVVGPDFDPAKFKLYRDDFKRLRTACESFRALVRSIDSVMPKKAADAA